MYSNRQKGNHFTLLTGIYPPDQGGPATFAINFTKWAWENHKAVVDVISLTEGDTQNIDNRFRKTQLISRKYNLQIRMLITIYYILKANNSGNKFLCNGLFFEILAAKLLNPRIKYVVKIPGDVVWERSRNKRRTNLSIIEFQKSKLNLSDKINRILFTLTLKLAEKIITPSAELRDFIVDWGLQEDKIEIIGNSANEHHFRKLPIDPDIDLLCVSRLVSWKNIDIVIKVALKLGLTLLIAGSGEEKSKLQEMAIESDGKIEFLGDVKFSDLPKLYNRCKIFVLNSDYEGMPHSLIEAQLCGVFCIANGQTGSREVIEHGITGTLINSHSEEDLEAAIIDYFSQLQYTVNSNQIREKAMKRFGFNHNYTRIYQALMK